MVLAQPAAMANGSQACRRGGTGPRIAWSAAVLLFLVGVPGAAMAGSKTASLRIGAQVVASVNLSAKTTPAGKLGVEQRSFGGKPGAVLVQQRSGAPLQLRGGARLPTEADAPLELATADLQLAFRRPAGPAEVVVTIFSDGTPPRG